jgi:protein JBTS26
MGDADEQERSTIVEIPTLPRGKLLEFRIFSTWGDEFYVGLSGIDVFDEHGNQIEFSNASEQISAIPSDINELEEYTADPRIVQNIVNGVNRTKDDFQMWIAPFISTRPNLLFLRFDEEMSISMVSMWVRSCGK